jgi:hypothetical protein
MSEVDGERRIGFEIKLNAEAEAVLTNAVFLRSPVLSKLLRYLIVETAAGRGDLLKSYAVAVDGLGRPATFDSASDSSARVQMARLRKALESHYAHNGPADDQCLYLQPGSYRVRLGKLSVAYPALYRPLSDADRRPATITPPNQTGLTPDIVSLDSHSINPVPEKSRSRFRGRNWFIGCGIVVGLAAALLAWFGWQQFGPAKRLPVSPVLEVLPVENANSTALIQTSRIVSSTFADDLPRFKISRVRVVRTSEDRRQLATNDNIYRLSSRLEDDVNGGQLLYLSLNDARTNIALWSNEIHLGGDPKAISDSLVSVIADINGPFGVIASHGSMLYRDRDNGGYACLLKYYAFVQARVKETESEIAACFAKPVKEQRLQATMLATNALFTIERSSAMKNFDAASAKATKLARAAVAIDPNDPTANFAVARLSYLINDCVSARYYTGRAVDTNPNSPLILANLAALAPMCDYPGSAALLDRAFLAQSPRYPRGRLLITLAALQHGRMDKVAEIKPSDIPQSPFGRVNYYLSETLIAGAQGKRQLSARNWKQFVAAQPLQTDSPDELLRPIIVLPPLRRKLIKLLDDAGAFED